MRHAAEVVNGIDQSIVVERFHLTPINYNPFAEPTTSIHACGDTSRNQLHMSPQRDQAQERLDSDDEILVPSSIPFENNHATNANPPFLHDSVAQEVSVIPRITTNRVLERSILGERNVECRFCGAIMWLEEKVAHSSNINPKFGLCCQSGKVLLALLPPSPEYLDELLKDRFFMENIRSLNSMFCFTSMGGKIDRSVQDGRGPPCFKISGENYHRIGSLLPSPGQMHSFVQLYICDTENEVRNRLNILRNGVTNSGILASIVEGLKTMLDNVNPYVQIFRSARDALQHDSGVNLHIRILHSRSNRQYNQPTASEIAALIVGDETDAIGCRDIIVCKNDGYLKRISETHPSYTPLQYPLLFPYGTDGWRVGIPYNVISEQSKEGRIFMREFWAFRLQYRNLEGSTLLQGGRLFNQLAVDCYAAIEQQRLNYIKTHQAEMRGDLYQGLEDAQTNGQRSYKHVDEVKQYLDCRYVSAIEACWRIYEFELQRQNPNVERLQFHLPNQQFVIFREEDHLHNIISREGSRDTMLTKWFEANKKYAEARSLTYVEFPTAWVWKRATKEWVMRKQGKCIGRLPYLHPNAGEKYYLRMLLYKVRGAQCFEDLRTFNGVVYQTFKQACSARGLLDDDNEWHGALSEAETWASSIKLRNMFSTMLMFSEITDPVTLWEQHWRAMVDDLQYRVRRELRDNNIQLSDEDLKEWGLQEIEYVLNRNGKSLADFPPMPQPSFRSFSHITNRLIREELDYNDSEEEQSFHSYFNGMNEDQVMHLKINMRLIARDGSTQSVDDLRNFAEWIDKIGEGKAKCLHFDDGVESDWVELPENLLIENGDNSLLQLINTTYPELSNRYRDPTYLKGKAILAPKNSDVDDINSIMLSMLPGEVRQFCSADTLCPGEMTDHEQNMNPPELLNSIKISGIPNHCLELKEGSPIMLLRNLNQSLGLCNGTRLIISKMGEKVLEARVVTGSHIGDIVTLCTPLELLNPHGGRFNIRVRLIRLIDACRHEYKIRILKMLFVDCKGFIMQGVAYDCNANHFITCLAEGNIYNINDIFGLVVYVTRCRLTPNGSSMRELVLLDTTFLEDRRPQKLVSLIRASRFSISRTIKISNAKRIWIREYGHLDDVRFLRILARIEMIDIDNIWYATCNHCQDSCTSYYGQIICRKCNDVVDGTIRFRVYLRVKDNSGVIDLKLLNEQAEYIFRRQATYLKKLQEQGFLCKIKVLISMQSLGKSAVLASYTLHSLPLRP
ncbi:hypothetical protein BUALT_Bualt17G0108200 [Buddleja alternifolia]|uniref:ATP-dependent DNA helicase n=1 Tax=Buddleja alternifolia TaxID=168488 RepID=A0AAV6WIB4_9LAMI|nr:hypothetical protein BUALT_Bualt17G0108200 [Buddleja alternifolia]